MSDTPESGNYKILDMGWAYSICPVSKVIRGSTEPIAQCRDKGYAELICSALDALTTAPEPLDTVSISRGAAEYAAECMEAEEMRIRELSRALLDDSIPKSLIVKFDYLNEIMKALEQQEQSDA